MLKEPRGGYMSLQPIEGTTLIARLSDDRPLVFSRVDDFAGQEIQLELGRRLGIMNIPQAAQFAYNLRVDESVIFIPDEQSPAGAKFWLASGRIGYFFDLFQVDGHEHMRYVVGPLITEAERMALVARLLKAGVYRKQPEAAAV